MNTNRRKKVLVIYMKNSFRQRRTIEDSLYCFRKYVKDIDFYYYTISLDYTLGNALSKVTFDAVIFHYTFFAAKYVPDTWNKITSYILKFKLAKIKAAIIQDEYINTDGICNFLKACKMDYVFTLVNEEAVKILYPGMEETKFIKVLTGYVDDYTLKTIEKLRASAEKERPLDIGYRARRVPYSLGAFGTLKMQIVDQFLSALPQYPNLRYDIKNTHDDSDTFLGLDWFRFLLRCRTMPGCLGGSSILDGDGSLHRKIDGYMITHPEASFEEVSDIYINDREGSVPYYPLSPRFFECAMTKTCMALVKGDYEGILTPGVHFIEIESDFSNLHDVIKKIEDKAYCEQMAEKAYQDLVASGKYTYKTYAHTVFEHIFIKNTHSEGNFSAFRTHLIIYTVMFFIRYLIARTKLSFNRFKSIIRGNA